MKKAALILTCLLLAACQSMPDYAGKWSAPEGKYIILNPGLRGNYDVIVSNVDGTRTYPGRRDKSGKITFARNGIVETVTPITGDKTGDRWLARKKDCLLVKAGEAYCRGADMPKVAPSPAPVAMPDQVPSKKWWRFWE